MGGAVFIGQRVRGSLFIFQQVISVRGDAHSPGFGIAHRPELRVTQMPLEDLRFRRQIVCRLRCSANSNKGSDDADKQNDNDHFEHREAVWIVFGVTRT